MATDKNTKKASATKPLPAAAEKQVATVAAGFPGDVRTAAERYARKLLKQKAGLRASSPPTTGLSKKQAESVRDALGLSKPAEPS